MFPTLDLNCEENVSHGRGSWFALSELLKLQERGLFPDDPAKKEVVYIYI
jgi:hypothetical protein